MSLFGKHFICTEDWELQEITKIINLAVNMKKQPTKRKWQALLKNKSFLMLFYNPSLRTHLSFETAVSELGGHPIYRTNNMNWEKTFSSKATSESLKDIARVASRYVQGIGIRITMNSISQYGEGHQFIRDFASYANVPIINMADDKVHPCQALADVMGWAERFSPKTDLNSLKKKTLLISWGRSGLARPLAAVQSHLLLAAQLGMNIRLAYPEGYDLDRHICAQAKRYCEQNQTSYEESHDPNFGYDGTHVVYVRNWVSSQAYQDGSFQSELEIQKALSYHDWTVTQEKMQKTNQGIFANPMPVDRGNEAEDSVIDGPQSVIYDVAENRKYVQKALLASLLGGIL